MQRLAVLLTLALAFASRDDDLLAAAPGTWDFTVFLDKRQIGSHRFVVTQTAEGEMVSSRAQFDVRILGFSAYHYDHHDTELWSDGCLRQISSRTNANGRNSEVEGASTAGHFVVKTLTGTSTLPGCVSTFAYWAGAKFLTEQSRLLNSQNGEYPQVTVAGIEAANTRWQGKDVAIQRLRITAPALDITLGFAAEGGDWLTLESVVEGRRRLRYLRN